MRIEMGWISVLLSVGVLAGCQSDSVKFALKDQRVGAQAGLQIDWLRDFGREGRLASEPDNIGADYLERGELSLRLFRVTNTSEEMREIYPLLPLSGEGRKVNLSQYYWAMCPRSSYECDVLSGASNPPMSELLTEYFSEYEVVEAYFDFGGGTREKVEFSTGPEKLAPVRLRPGESGVLTLRLRFRPGFEVYFTERTTPMSGPSGINFLPRSLNHRPGASTFRVECLMGIRLTADVDIRLIARDPETDELHPLYLSTPPSPANLFTVNAAAFRISFPPPNVARRLNGLAEQF